MSATYHNRHILVSGGGGYIGSAVVAGLLDAGCRVTVLDHQPRPAWLSAAPATLRWQQGDVTESASWHEAIRDADSVWHLAAIEAPYSPTGVERDWDVNALSVIQLTEACRAANVHPHIMLASSANIYGHVDQLPVSERMPDNPGRIWSAHKLLAEHYLAIFSEQYNLPATILRLANVYGPAPAPGSDQHVVINRVIRAGLADNTITLFANAGCVRDYLYLPDVVAAWLAAGNAAPPHCQRYVIGSGEAVTLKAAWHLLAEVLKELTDKEVAVTVDNDRKLDQAEYRNFVADSSLFASATGWRAATSLREGFTATAAWCLARQVAPAPVESGQSL